MPDVVGKATYQLETDATGVTKGLKSAEGQIKKTGAAAEKAFSKQTTSALDKMKTSISGIAKGGGIGGALLGGLGIGAGLSVMSTVTDFLGDAGAAASDLAETQSKLTAVFDTQADSIRAWAADSAHSMGLSTQAALEATGTFGNFLEAMGQAEPEAAKMSEAMVQLATDLGSFNNADPTEVLLALRSGLSGESEPLRKFGVDISDAAVSAQLLSDGIQKVKGQFTTSQKIMGRYELIMKQTTTAQGDFARTAGGTANATKIAASEIENAKAKVGVFVNDLTNAATKAIPPAIDAVLNLADAYGKLWNTIADVSDILNPSERQIRQWVNDLARMPEAARLTREQLEAIAREAVIAGTGFEGAAQDVRDMRYELDHIKPPQTFEQLEHSLENFRAELDNGMISTETFNQRLEALARKNWPVVMANFERFGLDFQGVVEGMGLDIDVLVKHIEAAGDLGTGEYGRLIMANLDTLKKHFDKLPADLQQALRDLGAVATDMSHTFENVVPSIEADISPLANIVKGTLKKARDEAEKGMADVRWALKHGGEDLRSLKRIYKNEMDGLMAALATAERQGKTVAIATIETMISELQAKMDALDQAEFTMHVGLAYGGRVTGRGHHAAPQGGRHGPHIGRRAMGGPVDAFQPYIVGEHRPEVFVPRVSGTILPSVESARTMSTSYTVNVTGLVRAETPEDIGRQMRRLAMMGAPA
jgi:hypothetical protein